MGLIHDAMRWGTQQLARRAPQGGHNPWLEGRFAPVTAEHTRENLRVTGRIPAELNGLYARIGPNPLRVGNPATYHWFTGDGMVHGVQLRDGQAQWYRNRWVGTDAVQDHFGRPRLQAPARPPFDVVNTNIFSHGGRLWATVEAGPLPIELDRDLNSLRRGLFDSTVSAAFSAHPHRDPATGALHAICYDGLKPFRVQHIVVDRHCAVTRVESIPVRHGPMIHDSAITQSSVVILDLPVTFSVAEMLRGYPFPYRWNPKHAARVGLLPKQGKAGDIRWFEVDPCFVFHPCNAFDTDDSGAVLDVVVHARTFDRSHVGPDTGPITFERWTLDPLTRRVSRRVLSTAPQEFPRFDERLAGSDYRFAYTAGFDPDSQQDQPLYRHDLRRGVTVQHHLPAGMTPGEFVFVPHTPDAGETDGWLLGFAHAVDGSTTDLVILNADDFEGAPQAIVHLDQPVPMGFHGNWIC